MIFTETFMEGVYIIEPELREDERGFFGRTFCRREFGSRGLKVDVAQVNYSFNARRGTLRGMHYQAEPCAEAKLIHCLQGAVYDVVIDLRTRSDTYCRHLSLELSGDSWRLLYVPEGFAHGFQALKDNSALCYLMFDYYAPQYARGVRWNDPAFGIEWPLPAVVISENDRSWPDYKK